MNSSLEPAGRKLPPVLQVYHKGVGKAMRKARRILTALLIVNFFCGMQAGMKAENLILILINGLAVIILAVAEIRRERR